MLKKKEDWVNEFFLGRKNIITLLSTKNTFSYKDLVRIMQGRIDSQSREFKSINILYPIRFIKYCFSVQEELDLFNKWRNSIIDEIIVYADDQPLRLKDLTKLVIQPNEFCYVFVKGKAMLLQTKDVNGKIIPLKSSKINDISIDHIESLSSVLTRIEKQLPIINSISDKIRDYAQKDKSKISGAYLNDLNKDVLENYKKTIDLEALLSELNLISSETKLQLMHRSNNSRKNK